jgi:hypothetical protein
VVLLQDLIGQDGFLVHPALADAATHLGAMVDTDEWVAGIRQPARIPVALGAYHSPQKTKNREVTLHAGDDAAVLVLGKNPIS